MRIYLWHSSFTGSGLPRPCTRLVMKSLRLHWWGVDAYDGVRRAGWTAGKKVRCAMVSVWRRPIPELLRERNRLT